MDISVLLEQLLVLAQILLGNTYGQKTALPRHVMNFSTTCGSMNWWEMHIATSGVYFSGKEKGSGTLLEFLSFNYEHWGIALKLHTLLCWRCRLHLNLLQEIHVL